MVDESKVLPNYESVNNHQRMERKILIVGSVGAGKSTCIRTLSNSNTRINLDSKFGRVDSGQIKLVDRQGDSTKELISIHSINAEDLFSIKGMVFEDEVIGIVLLLDNRRKDPLYDLGKFLMTFAENKPQQILAKIAIGVSHFDVSRTPAIRDYHSYLNNLDLLATQKLPIFSVDTRVYSDLCQLLSALFHSATICFIEEVLTEKQPG